MARKQKKIKTRHPQDISESQERQEQEIVELISDDKWNLWLSTLTNFITELEGVINVLDLLGRIKYKIENCSRSYTAMWTLDTLIECWKQNETSLEPSFKASIDRLQREWNMIYEPVKEQRKQLLAMKCILFYISECKEKEEILSPQEYMEIMEHPSYTPHDQWTAICKRAHEKGFTSILSYKQFLGKLMVEMTKY
jgi:hypothetical protein